MKKTTIILLGIFILSNVYAEEYYAGSTYNFTNEMGIENLVYTIVNNISQAPNIIVKINKENITITFPSDMKPNSFDIVFIEEQTNTIVQTIHSGGGGHSTKYIKENITTIQPLFLDRNITIGCEDKECDTKEIEQEKQEEEKKIWYGILLIELILMLIIYILYMYIINRKKQLPYIKKYESRLDG